MVKTLSFLIGVYQKINRLLCAPSCRFYPSCSCYAREAIEKYGAWRGMTKAICRILRCSPFSAGGYDPLR
ncbi:MAG: membrane protein insertion efficiency factor YidD [Candidatus Omnitrophica bacterium]|jgi:hypothetical protein|nr:membrane protein insertion efficiency factor YidD [Candidatus Omnitrophota bacterium]